MSNINNTDNVGGRTPHVNTAPIYPINGESPTYWGNHYDWDVRQRIVNDIANGVLGLEDMASMLDLGRSYIMDWGRKYRPDFFGLPRKRLNKSSKVSSRNGSIYNAEEKANIAKLITSGRYSLDKVSKMYQLSPSVLERWIVPGRRFLKNRTQKPRIVTVQHKPAPAVASPAKSEVDQLLSSPEHARLVINLLLNDSPAKAHAVAKALLVR